MTDKDLDRLLKGALSSDEVPSHLNESLLLKAQKKKAKIFTFTKTFSSLAAVFVCAVAVLSYFNSDLFSQNNAIPPMEINEITPKKDSATALKDVSQPAVFEKQSAEEENAPAPVPEKKASAEPHTAAVTSEDTDAVIATDSTQEEAAFDTACDTEAVAETEIAEEAEVNNSIFAMRRAALPESLDMLFNEGYDYKDVISKKISLLISESDFAQEINFSQISENEKFSLNEENVLTIEFSAGTIAPEEHGDLFFTVGTVQNGVLVE